MKYQVLDLVQGTPEWLAARREKVTASQIPVILGLSSYSKPGKLLMEKFTGVEEQHDSFKQRLFDLGHQAEAAGRQWINNQFGLKLEPAVLLSNENPDLLASLDGFDPKEDLIFEAKYMGKKALAEVAQGRIKPDHMFQVQAQLRVSGVSKCLYFAVDETRDAKIVEIKPDPSSFVMIDEAVQSFMKDLNDLRAKRQEYLDFMADLETKYKPARKRRKAIPE